MRIWILLGCLFALGFSTAQASWVQYDVSTFQVLGAFATEADMRLTPTSAPLEIPGVAVADIAWPLPPDCARGKKEWTLVTAPGELPLVLNPTLIFFRCQPVTSLRELRGAAMRALDQAASLNTGLRNDITTDILTILSFAQNACVQTNGTPITNTNCNTIRSNNQTIGSKLGTLAQVIDLQTEIAAIYQDFQAVKDAQGW